MHAGGPPERPVASYDYVPSRGGAVPVSLLEGYQGYPMIDGCAGYSAVARIEGIEPLV